MWAVDDLKRAAARRNEDQALSQDIERIILAAERAAGRTEETLSRDAGRAQLTVLLADLDVRTVPAHVLNDYPILSITRVPAPLPAEAFDRAALAAFLRANDANLKTSSSTAPPKIIDLEPDPPQQSRSPAGPTR